jgi:hypothetical protein
MGGYCPTQVREQVSFTTHPGRGESVERDEGAENDSKKTAAQRLSATTSYQHLHFRYSQDYVKKEFCDSALLSQNNTFGLHWGVGY